MIFPELWPLYASLQHFFTKLETFISVRLLLFRKEHSQAIRWLCSVDQNVFREVENEGSTKSLRHLELVSFPHLYVG